jgi:hypothetical protein
VAMEDLHHISVVKIDDMLHAMFPQVDPTLARAGVGKLKSNGRVNVQGHWTAFDVERSKR